jgi:UDP:flavonoid glycosyltransferase YjiC (YdhE family)
MRIKYMATGTSGDVRPAIAFSLGLQKAGHQVSVITTPDFKALVTTVGLEYISITDDEIGEFIPEPPTKKLLNKLWNVFQDADAIICIHYWFLCSYIAEKLKIPFFISSVIPFSPTNSFPFAFASSKPNLGRILNALSYHFVDQRLWQFLRKSLNQWREEDLSLPPLSYWSGIIRWLDRKQIPCLYHHSPALLAKPPDWQDWVHVTGYWFLDNNSWQPPKDLVAFLEAGSPPIYIGFGHEHEEEWNSKTLTKETLTKIVLEALKRSGQRGILLKGKDYGFSDRIQLPKEVFTIEWASFEWLFPRMAAIVHHGGLGTIHAVLKAGVPSIIVPYDVDNVFWGNRLVELGLSPPLIQQKQLSAEKLTEAINFVVTNKSIFQKAAEISQQVRREDGVTTAVKIFHQHLQDRSIHFSKSSQELLQN